MQRKVWIFQYRSDVKTRGPDGSSWFVGFYGIDGKRKAESCGPGSHGRKKAERRSRQLEGQLEAGTYRSVEKVTWQEFRSQWESQILPCKRPATQEQYRDSLDHFERIIKPGRLATITAQTIDQFVATRLREPGKGRDADGKPLPVSRATVNHDLRVVKLFLRTAHEWELFAKVPRIRMLKELRHEIRQVSAEHFNAMFEAAAGAVLPQHVGQNYSAGDWWQTLLATAYLTGMRIGELLALQWPDVDLEAGTYTTRAEQNKAGRDETLPLHPVVVEQLKRIRGFKPHVFPWEYDDRTLYAEFHRVQAAAGIIAFKHERKPADALPRKGQPKRLPNAPGDGSAAAPKPAKRWQRPRVEGKPYGFHDLRRSFGSIQATRVEAAVLKRLMRHSSVATTLKFYVNVDGALRAAINATPIPTALRAAQ